MDQYATTYACSVINGGGQTGPVEVTIKRDATPPEVTVTGVEEHTEYLLPEAFFVPLTDQRW